MRFATLGSGSAGNATIVQHEGTAVLIDCGLSARQVEQRAATLGFDIAALDAILVTHEHDDHVAGVAAVARRVGAQVFASAGTCRAAAARFTTIANVQVYAPDSVISIGALKIAPVIVPHDAREPCQFVITAGAKRLGILTDVGQITAHLRRHYAALHGLVLEFNHEPELLAKSAYPHSLKSRIGGHYGHLSNDQSEQLLASLDLSRLQHCVAAHLSENTNSPARVEARLARALPAHVNRHIAAQAEASPWCDFANP